jgi:N-dimethylarginine dimethylaminohydrolase
VGPSQRIKLDHAEAALFSANAVSFDHCLVLSACTDALRRKFEERGFTVLTTPLHAFLRSGGSACCLTLRLDHRSEQTNS